MSEPVVFISHFRVKEGALEAFEQLNREVARSREAEKPRTLVFLTYMDQASSRVSFLHVFADQEFDGPALRGFGRQVAGRA